jgi:hypothetical protein
MAGAAEFIGWVKLPNFIFGKFHCCPKGIFRTLSDFCFCEKIDFTKIIYFLALANVFLGVGALHRYVPYEGGWGTGLRSSKPNSRILFETQIARLKDLAKSHLANSLNGKMIATNFGRMNIIELQWGVLNRDPTIWMELDLPTPVSQPSFVKNMPVQLLVHPPLKVHY